MPEQPVVASGQPAPSRSRARLLVWAPVLVAFLAGLVLAGTTAHQHTRISPYDEQAHFDYVVQLAENRTLPAVGSEYDAKTLKEIACRGIANPTGPVDAICPRTYQPINVPPNGINYLLGYSPLFYSVLGGLSLAVHSVFGISLFLAARFVVVGLFALGCATTVMALRRLGVPGWLSAALTVLVASFPAVVFQGATVTPDGLALLVGSTGLLVATADRPWRTRLVLATLLALVAAQVKISFVPVVAVVVLLTAVWPPGRVLDGTERPRWPERPRLLRRAAAVVAAGLSIPATVLLVNEWRASSLPEGASADGGMSESLAASAGLKQEVVGAAHMMLEPLTFWSHNTSMVLSLIADVVQTGLVGGVLLVALLARERITSVLRTSALAAVLAWLATVVMLPTAFYVMYQATGTQPRYALPMLPLLLVPVALVLGRGRWVQVGAGLLAAWAFGLSLWVSVQL